jgi:stage V sporulation protein SpoVS
VPPEIRRSLELWVGCVAGALREDEYGEKLRAVGFEAVEVEPWRIYDVEDARTFLAEAGVDVDRLAMEVDGKVASAFIRARRPQARSCCGPSCCS